MLIAFLFFGSVPFWIRSVGLYEYIGVEILIWCIYALGYNLALGYTGLPSFGHGAFLGTGAYAMALYQLRLDGENLWLGLLAAVAAGAVASAVVGVFISHRRGIYFALLTIAFGQLFWFVSIKWHSVTGGEDGLQNLKRLQCELGFASFTIQENVNLYWFTFILFMLTVVGLWTVIHSPFGRVIQAVKQNEMRCKFIGYDVRIYKWMSFTISGAIAGLAGGLFSLAQQSAYPDVMSIHQSGIVVMMTVIGGGFVCYWGPVYGTIFYFCARDVLGAHTETWLLWYGLLFMLIVMFKPEGLAGIRWRDLRGWISRLVMKGRHV